MTSRSTPRDESYFENMRPFHEHYMPSREILAHGLEEIETLPVKLIAPQHGKLIREDSWHRSSLA